MDTKEIEEYMKSIDPNNETPILVVEVKMRSMQRQIDEINEKLNAILRHLGFDENDPTFLIG